MKNQEPLRRFLLNLCKGDGQLSDDIAQEAFIKAFLHLSSFNDRSLFSTWLFSIAYHCFCDNKKAAIHYSPTEVETLVVKALETSDSAYRNQELYLAISRLNHKERSVILLFYMEEKSIVEIARIMDMPINTVKSHLSRAKIHISQYLKSIGYER